MNTQKPAAVILAGGRSSRMGGQHKALMKLGGQSLLAHVIRRLESQVDTLLLNCESDTRLFDGFGLPLVPDLLPGFRGPLTGLYSVLGHLADTDHKDGLVLCPCDAPFVPENLVQRLCDASQGVADEVVVISYLGELQPTFSLWQNHHLEVIQEAVTGKGIGGLKYMMKSLPIQIVEWPEVKLSPFFNINTPAELKTAETWLDHKH